MFGDSVLVSPVVVPLRENGTAPVSVWFPPGRGSWYAIDNSSETYPADGAWRQLWYPLSRTPAFVLSGSILTLLPKQKVVPFGAAGGRPQCIPRWRFGRTILGTL